MKKYLFATALVVFFSTQLAYAQGAMAHIMLSDMTLKHGIGARPGVIHGKIHNHGTQAVRLTAVTSPSFGRIELHTHIKADGVMRMRQVAGFDLAAGATLTLKPGGHHLMLFDHKIDDKNAPVSLQLVFDNGQKIQHMVSPRANAMQHDMMHHKGH